MKNNTDLILELLDQCGMSGKPNYKGEMPLQFCCFHNHNFGSPSLQINVFNGAYYCYSCHCKGNIRKIFYEYGIENPFDDNKIHEHSDFEKELGLSLTKLFDLPEEEKNHADVNELKDYRYYHPYLLERGFSKEILKLNNVGFDKETCRVTIPIHFNGKYHGCVKRTVIDELPRYVQQCNMQKSSILYIPKLVNVNDDKKIFIVEGNLDALKVAQFGSKAASILGCHISKVQLAYLDKLGLDIVLALDNDEPGKEGIKDVLSRTRNFNISVLQFPKGVKDLGDIKTQEEFDSLVKNNLKHRLKWMMEN